ncbi:c-type cytochrome domain-containing protein [Kaarinaea lacus]
MTSYHYFRLYLLLGLLVPLIVLPGCGKTEKAQQVVSYSKAIVPILEKYCLECHLPGGPGQQASGLDMSTYESLMKGTKFGSVIKPGDSLSSTLVILVEGRADPSIRMPHGNREGLTPEEMKTLRLWIDQGASNN